MTGTGPVTLPETQPSNFYFCSKRGRKHLSPCWPSFSELSSTGRGLTSEWSSSSTLSWTAKAVHLSLTLFYQVQKSSNYFGPSCREIRSEGYCNPHSAADRNVSSQPQSHQDSELVVNFGCQFGVFFFKVHLIIGRMPVPVSQQGLIVGHVITAIKLLHHRHYCLWIMMAWLH